VIGVVAIVAARMTRDEIEHPLDSAESGAAPESAVAVATRSDDSPRADLGRSPVGELAGTPA
jgi:hypothetical protein